MRGKSALTTTFRASTKALTAVLLMLSFFIGEKAFPSESEEPAANEAAPYSSFFSKDYFKLLYEDTVHVLTAPARFEKKEWATFAIATAGVAAVSLLDKPAWDLAKRNQTSSRDDIASIVEKAGGGYTAIVPVVFYIAGEVSHNSRARICGLDSLSASMIASGIIHPSLKFLAGRSLPKDEKGTYDFNPLSFSLPQSFPSGHSTQSFVLASVISAHYPEPWVQITSYGIATLASLARTYQGKHFVSDWAAGALIGTVVGRAVVKFNEKKRSEKKESSLFLVPFVHRGASGLNLVLQTD